MSTHRKSIPLLPHEDTLLRELYLLWRIPTDQYEKRPGKLGQFTEVWNGLAARSDTQGEVIHYMRTKRKKGRWVRFDGEHERLPPEECQFCAEELRIAEEVYVELMGEQGLGSDNFAYDDLLARQLSRAFAKRTGRIVPGLVLSAALITMRKRGELAKIGRRDGGSGDIGFGDIDEVVG